MRRLSGVLLAGAILMLPAFSQNAGMQAQAPQKLTMEGDLALWSVAIRPDKTADFEQVMARLHEALLKSGQPTRQQQARGWKVVRLATPLPDGNVTYVHVVSPVIPEADYTVMQILYDELPDERQALYELYRGAFAKNLSLATGRTIADMSAAMAKAPSEVAAR